MSAVFAPVEADDERRFGGLRRLWGSAGYDKVRAARVAVVGVGGVGSWAAEALARCGVAELVLIDMDHVAESNINRQSQALGSTLGAAKVQALGDRLADIHPGCRISRIEAFASAENWPQLLPGPIDGLVDACDQGHAKLVLAQWALASQIPIVCSGAAGGKSHPERVEVADLAEVTHDPLLAALRQRLRKAGASRMGRMGVSCVFSRESVVRVPEGEGAACIDASAGLNCHGFGSSVMVTSAFGMTAAAEILRRMREPASRSGRL